MESSIVEIMKVVLSMGSCVSLRESGFNGYLVQEACLSVEYQVLSMEQWYGTGPQDQRTMEKVHQGSIPNIIRFIQA